METRRTSSSTIYIRTWSQQLSMATQAYFSYYHDIYSLAVPDKWTRLTTVMRVNISVCTESDGKLTNILLRCESIHAIGNLVCLLSEKMEGGSPSDAHQENELKLLLSPPTTTSSWQEEREEIKLKSTG